MVFWFRALLGGLLLALFAYISVFNAINGWRRHVRKMPRDWVPLIGGLLGAAAMCVFPVSGLGRYWWLPLLIDWGSAPGLTYAGVLYLRLRRAQRTSRKQDSRR